MNALAASVAFEFSVCQKQLWKATGRMDDYYSEIAIDIEGPLDGKRLIDSLGTVVSRHEVLSFRCLMNKDSELPFQAPLKEHHLVTPQAGTREECMDRPYDPSADSPIRFYLAKVSDDKHCLFVRLYALWGDSYSCSLLYQELYHEYFNSNASGQPDDRIEYRNFSKWQNDLLIDPEPEAVEFWRNCNYFPSNAIIPFGRTDKPGFSPAYVPVGTLSGGKYDELKKRGSGGNYTVSDILIAIFGIYLGRFTQKPMTIGYIPSKRPYDELNRTVGLISGSLPVTFSRDDMNSLDEAAGYFNRAIEEVQAWGDYFWSRELQRIGDPANSAFNYCFEFIDLANGAKSSGTGPAFGISKIYSVTSVFLIKLCCVDYGDKLEFELYYDKNRLDQCDVSVITAQLELQLNDSIDVSANLIRLSNQEKELLRSSNNTKRETNTDKSVVALFKDMAAINPGKPAVIGEGVSITYGEMDDRSDQLAWILMENHDVKAGDLVGIMLNRSHWVITGLLGILKSGAAYIPIDPDYPPERIEYILKDGQAKLLISETELINSRLKGIQTNILDIRDGNIYRVSRKLCSNISPEPDSLAYIIYTSGSTGAPKGCMISHKNLSNYIQWASEYYFGDSDDGNWGLVTSLSFDLTVTCLYTSLIRGKTLYIGSGSREMGDLLKEAFENPAIDTLKLTPAHLLLVGNMDIPSTHIKNIICGGEQLTVGQVNTIWRINKNIRIYNEYGPTETTVGAVVKEIRKSDEKILIGKPIANTTVYISDENARLVSVGEQGRIYIGGDGVGAGYIHRTELTADKFKTGRFKAGERVYDTGDWGRWLPDGNIEFIGRADDQVKIKGYRIEPGEIEAALQGHPDIDAAAVVVRTGNDSEKSLVAYWTGENMEPGKIREFLSRSLPAYMMPVHYVWLAEMPLTINGKIDRKKLPDIADQEKQGVIYQAPHTEEEKQLIAVLEEVFKRNPIGIKDNFFLLGGDSIKSIQVVSRLKRKGYSLVIRDIMLFPVVEELAGCLKAVTRESEQGIIEGPISLGPIQAAFFESPRVDKHHFNQSVLLESTTAIDEDIMRSVLNAIVLHHDALRMVYQGLPDGWTQYNRGREQTYSMEVLEVNDEASFREHCDRIQSTIDLGNGPLVKVGLFRGGPCDRILLVIHHLAVDGISWRILLEDLCGLYLQYIAGEHPSLPAKTDSFRIWQDRQLEYSRSERLLKERDYWTQIEALPVVRLPLENPGGSNLIADESVCSFLLNGNITGLLLNECYEAYSTEINDILLAALSMAMKTVFNMGKILIKLEGHGREDIGTDTDVSRTIGWFTSAYPVVLDASHHADIIRHTIEVKETLHRIPNKGIGYGILRYLSRMDYRLMPEITFNYLGDFGSALIGGEGERLFEFSGKYRGRERSADSPREATLDVFGLMVEGQLRLSIGYSTRQFTVQRIESLLEAYRQHLTDLIKRLSAEKKKHLSPVDLTYKGLTIEELQKLNQLIC
jgi:amino acid adenylation domain-containing protein/non-ribosomal peptide synthase protein (TIGR01720 family)